MFICCCLYISVYINQNIHIHMYNFIKAVALDSNIFLNINNLEKKTRKPSFLTHIHTRIILFITLILLLLNINTKKKQNEI